MRTERSRGSDRPCSASRLKFDNTGHLMSRASTRCNRELASHATYEEVGPCEEDMERSAFVAV